MLKKVINFFKKQSNFRYIAFGFLFVIFLGSGLLMIPGCIKNGVKLNYIDALYTSTSAVCVTGLIAVDVADTFTVPGQLIVMFLIQIGGLGVTTLGAGLIVAIRRHISLKERNIIQESLNVEDAKGLLGLFKKVFIYTFIIEFIGASLSLITFAQNFSFGEAIYKSIFHSIASFNNSGFDILGGLTNYTIAPYNNDVLFNLVTCGLIILGGLGFLVIADVIHTRHFFKKTSLHTKVVLLMTTLLIILGTLLLAFTERNHIIDGSFTWLGAFFTSVSARTAGFSTFALGSFTKAGQLVVIILMFIGASPGSTGGGIKTTTLFVVFMGIRSMVTHKSTHAFKYTIPKETVKKAMVINLIALALVIFGSFLMCLFEAELLLKNSQYSFIDVLFEITSAFGTVGLSTGITPYLCVGSKLLSIIIMYIGRVGPLTFISLWQSNEEEYYSYAEGIIPVG